MHSLNLDQLRRAFFEVIERGSFTADTKELNLTQPAVTHQVQELERRFKVPLVGTLRSAASLLLCLKPRNNSPNSGQIALLARP
jgi:hypothetical protein